MCHIVYTPHSIHAEGLKGGAPPPGSSPTSAEGPSFTYSGVDPDMARRLFESLFGGAGGFSFTSMPGAAAAGGGGGTPGAFQFMSTGPGGQFMSSAGPGGQRSFNVHTSGGTNNRRRWASAFGGDDSEEEMFTAGAPGTDPFSGYNMGGMGPGMGGMGPGSFFQQQWQPPGSSGGWSGSFGMRGGNSAGGSPQFGGFGRQHRQQQRQQLEPQVLSLQLSLEELYSGCTKRLKVGVAGTRHRSFVEHIRFCCLFGLM